MSRLSPGKKVTMAPISNGTVNNRIATGYMETLIAGDRDAARKFIDSALAEGSAPIDLLNDLIWPTMELLQTLYRDDRISVSSLNLATRLNRAITDQLTVHLTRAAANGKKVLIFCGHAEPEELGGQITADMF